MKCRNNTCNKPQETLIEWFIHIPGDPLWNTPLTSKPLYSFKLGFSVFIAFSRLFLPATSPPLLFSDTSLYAVYARMHKSAFVTQQGVLVSEYSYIYIVNMSKLRMEAIASRLEAISIGSLSPRHLSLWRSLQKKQCPSLKPVELQPQTSARWNPPMQHEGDAARHRDGVGWPTLEESSFACRHGSKRGFQEATIMSNYRGQSLRDIMDIPSIIHPKTLCQLSNVLLELERGRITFRSMQY